MKARQRKTVHTPFSVFPRYSVGQWRGWSGGYNKSNNQQWFNGKKVDSDGNLLSACPSVSRSYRQKSTFWLLSFVFSDYITNWK